MGKQLCICVTVITRLSDPNIVPLDIECDTVIVQQLSPKYFQWASDIPEISREADIVGVYCEFRLGFIFCLSD